jgi:hypothetical protein
MIWRRVMKEGLGKKRRKNRRGGRIEGGLSSLKVGSRQITSSLEEMGIFIEEKRD